MFLMFASPKASPVLYKAVVYEPTTIKNPRYPRYTQGPIDKKPTVVFKHLFASINAIKANIDASIVEVFLNNEESYLFYGAVITPESNPISNDNVVRIQHNAEWKDISRVITSTVKNTCAAIQAVFVQVPIVKK